MALDDDGMQNAYLTKLRVHILEDSDSMRQLSEMLHGFALGYNAQLEQAGRGVDHFSPQAQEFLEALNTLQQDWDVWVGQIAFSDILELQQMWNNREIWPRRLAKLPMIPAPPEETEQEPTPDLPPMMPNMGKGEGKGVVVGEPVGKGKGKGGGKTYGGGRLGGGANSSFPEITMSRYGPMAAPARAPSSAPPPTPSHPHRHPAVHVLRVNNQIGEFNYPYMTRVATAASAA